MALTVDGSVEMAVEAPAALMATVAATAVGVERRQQRWRVAYSNNDECGLEVAWASGWLLVGRAGEERWRTRWRCRGGARIAADLLVFVSSLCV